MLSHNATHCDKPPMSFERAESLAKVCLSNFGHLAIPPAKLEFGENRQYKQVGGLKVSYC